MILRFSYTQETLQVGEKQYPATCVVRNELNGWRGEREVVKSMPLSGSSAPYQPRRFPTGVWQVNKPEFTDDPEFAPVKIPTTARRRVFLWNVKGGEYSGPSGETQEDYFYHLHYSQYRTTLGCIRLDSARDAVEIAREVSLALHDGPVWIEVVV